MRGTSSSSSPNPFGPAYALDEIPQQESTDELEAGRSVKRHSNWSGETVCTWEEFALSGDALKKAAGSDAASASAVEEPYVPGVVDRLVGKVDAALSTKLKPSQIDQFTKAYAGDGVGTEDDPFVVKFIEGGKPNGSTGISYLGGPAHVAGANRARDLSPSADAPPSPSYRHRPARVRSTAPDRF